MDTVSSTQMKDLDFYAVNRYEYSHTQFIELGGVALFNFTLEQVKRLVIKKPKVFVFCGNGLKGAVGLAAVRHFYNRGIEVHYSLYSRKKPSPKIAAQQKILGSLNVQPTPPDTVKDIKCNILIDGLVGAGLVGGLHSSLMTLLDFINEQNALRISLDVPSGMHSGTGEPFPVCVKADFTLGLGGVGSCLKKKAAIGFVGQVSAIDVGIPRAAYEDVGAKYPFSC